MTDRDKVGEGNPCPCKKYLNMEKTKKVVISPS